MTARSLVRASSAYLAITAVEMASTMVSVPVMTRLLSPIEYGMLLLITNTTALINLLFGFSLAHALPALFSASTCAPRRRATATTIIWSIVGVSALAHGIVVVVAQQWSMDRLALPGTPPIVLAGLASFAMGVSLCLASLGRLRERPGLVAGIQIPAVVLQVALLFYFLIGPKLGLASLYLAMSTVGLATTGLYAWALRDDLTGHFDWRILLEALKISVRMLPWQFAILLATNTGGILLVRTGHVDEAGMFAVAAGLVAVLVGISNSFSSAWTPFVLNRHTEAGLVATQRLVFRHYSSGLMIAASGLALFAQEVFSVLLGPAFRPAFHYVPPLVLAYSMFCFAQAFSQGLQAKQEMRAYGAIGAVVAVVFLLVCLPLTGHFGVYGLTAAMGAAFLTMLIMLQSTSEKLLPVGYPWLRHGLMWSAAIGIVAVTYASGISWQGLALKATAVAVIVGLPFAFGVFSVLDIRNLWSMRPGSRT